MPCPVIAWTINSSSELIYYLIHYLGETDSENHHIGVHGAEKYYAMPRFHSSSVWFFLLEQRKTGMAIAIDVDGDDWRALSLIPAPLAPLKVGLMSTAVFS